MEKNGERNTKMLEIKRNKLEKAIDNKEPIKIVKDLFIDYKSSYKRLRKVTKNDDLNYEKSATRYVKYLGDNLFNERKTNIKND